MKILDCTFRDGGYYTNWKFSRNEVNLLINSLSNDVSIIELGYKSPHKDRGLWGQCIDQEVYEQLDNHHDNLCFMIDLKDFIKDGVVDKDLMSSLIKNCDESPFTYCRIAIKHHELPFLEEAFHFIKNLGYKVFINLMQTFQLSKSDVIHFMNSVSNLDVEGVYFADSYGNLKKENVSDWSCFSKIYSIPMGFHGHDNMGLAFSNSLDFLMDGFTYIDTTVTGLGRGSGNTRTEQVLLYKNRNLTPDQISLLHFFEGYLKQYSYGYSVGYMMGALNNLHPVSTQTILQKNISLEDKLNEIKSKKKVSVIIPARYKSSRFEGKPLAKIFDKEMIIHVCEKCAEAVGLENVYVATDDERIAEKVKEFGFQFIMTSEDNATGTDRVREAAKKLDSEIIVNVQGDEPFINPDDIKRAIEFKSLHPDCVVNCYSEIADVEDPLDTKIPKVVVSGEDLVYISRGNVPCSKNGSIPKYKQVCIYVFNKADLEIFNNQKTDIEKIEDIEIIRCLENGKKVKMLKLNSSSISVDYPEDIQNIESKS